MARRRRKQSSNKDGNDNEENNSKKDENTTSNINQCTNGIKPTPKRVASKSNKTASASDRALRAMRRNNPAFIKGAPSLKFDGLSPISNRLSLTPSKTTSINSIKKLKKASSTGTTNSRKETNCETSEVPTAKVINKTSVTDTTDDSGRSSATNDSSTTTAYSTSNNEETTNTRSNGTRGRCDIAGCVSDFQLHECRNNRHGCRNYVHHYPCGTENKHLQDPENESYVYCSKECKESRCNRIINSENSNNKTNDSMCPVALNSIAATIATNDKAHTNNKEDIEAEICNATNQVNDKDDFREETTASIESNENEAEGNHCYGACDFGELKYTSLINNIEDDVVKRDVLIMIEENIEHTSFKYFSDNDDSDLESPFPFSNSLINGNDYRVLARDPATTNDKYLLHAGYSILDLATQISFLGMEDMNWCPLPAIFFEQISVKRKKFEIGNDVDKILSMNKKIGSNLLEYKVADVTVFYDGRVSKAYILNASLALRDEHKYPEKDIAFPCIVVTNFGCVRDKIWHSATKVANALRTFYNDYSLAHNIAKSKKFNKNSMPVYTIEIDSQKESWMDFYSALISRTEMMKAIDELKYITKNDLENKRRSDMPSFVPLFSERFKSCNESEILKIRNDMKNIVKCLAVIRKFGAERSIDIGDPTSDDIVGNLVPNDDRDYNQTVSPIMRPQPKKMKRVSVDSLRVEGRRIKESEKQKERQKRKDAEVADAHDFDGRMNSGPHKKLKAKYKERKTVLKRNQGEGAASLESYHDEAHRRGLHGFGRGTLNYERMCRYVSESGNDTLRPASAYGIIFNPVAEFPDAKGKFLAPYRKEPQRLLISPHGIDHREQLRKLVKDLHENFDNYVIVDNLYDLDRMVMGDRDDDLKEFIANNRTSNRKAQDKSENQKLLENVPTIDLECNTNKRKNDEEEDVSVD